MRETNLLATYFLHERWQSGLCAGVETFRWLTTAKGVYFEMDRYQMNEKLPAPCEACRGSGIRHGAVCSECHGKGYRMFVNGRQIPVPQQKPRGWQCSRPAQNPRYSR
jgi:hypothetical protein